MVMLASCLVLSLASPFGVPVIHPANGAAKPCGACHSAEALAATDRSTNGVHFSHSVHNSAQIQCADCHAMVDGEMSRSSMTDCTSCHEREGAANRCDTCHLTQADGRLKTTFDWGKLKPSAQVLPHMAHGAAFAYQHADAAELDPLSCNECHSEDDCVRCHLTRSTMTAIHPSDYIRLHPVEARHNTQDCSSCHQPVQFCAACHQQAGVSPTPTLRQFGRRGGQRTYHPPGFTGSFGGQAGPNHHRIAARRDLNSCVSCHQEDDCVRCHSTTSPSHWRASPHPPGFRCGRALEVSILGCLTCHPDRQKLEQRCRVSP